MNLKLKKSIVLCLICTMLLGMMGIDASAADITYVYDDVMEMYGYVNSFRASADTNSYKDASGNDVAGQARPALVYDYNLERLAMTRAAELVANYAHRDITAEISSLGLNGWSENIAWGESYLGTAQSIFVAWREDNQPYSGQGHRRNMLTTDVACTSIGIGHVRANGRDYWVQVFGVGGGGGSRVDLNGTGTAAPIQEEPAAPATQYPVLDGANATWVKSSGSPMSIRVDADVSLFAGVVINGVTVDPSNYEVTEGSTIVTFKPEYMNLLSAGNYTCRVSFSDGGYADVPFTVDTTTSTENSAANSQTSTTETQNNANGTLNAATTTTRSPQTGDSTSSMIVVFLMLALVSGAAVCQISRKKVR